jgi:adenosine kinase
LETIGTQEWKWDRGVALSRLADAYGREASDEIAAALS